MPRRTAWHSGPFQDAEDVQADEFDGAWSPRVEGEDSSLLLLWLSAHIAVAADRQRYGGGEAAASLLAIYLDGPEIFDGLDRRCRSRRNHYGEQASSFDELCEHY